jgi:hypothetical protein
MSPVVPETADTNAQCVMFGGSALNGPHVNPVDKEVTGGSADVGAVYVTG